MQQLSAAFGGLRLADLPRVGLGVYDLIPSFRDRCPACGAADCAVRHGLYYRRVVDADGRRIDRLPVPRFRCRAGTCGGMAKTFSVLPRAVVPRRVLSLPLLLRIRSLIAAGGPRSAVLDELAAGDPEGSGAAALDERSLGRVVELLDTMAISSIHPHAMT